MLESLAAWFQATTEGTSWDFVFFYKAFEIQRILTGLWTTIELSAVCVFFSLVIGVFGAWLQGSPLKLLRLPVQAYIQFFRNTPPLIQLYFFYFALGRYTPTRSTDGWLEEPIIGAFGWAVISLSFFAGAFNVEIFRAGIEAVPDSTKEAAESLGYNRLQTYIHVVLPLAFRVSLPALNNNLVNLAKTTTLAYAITVPEMLYQANQIWSDWPGALKPTMLLLFLIYISLVGLLVYFMHRWEKKMRIPGYGS